MYSSMPKSSSSSAEPGARLPGRVDPLACTRREMLSRCAGGFGAVALAALLQEQAKGRWGSFPELPHFRPRARNVIFLYMDGGPSQVDTFDPKPRLAKEHGQPIQMKVPATQFDSVGNVLASHWEFRPYGECGTEVSDLFPQVGRCVDDLAVIRSMVAPFPEHTTANYFLHTGHGQVGRPSMGSWVSYGLGNESENLPGFVVLNGGLVPPGGLENFSSGFLPATFQGSVFKSGALPVANVLPAEADPRQQEGKLALLRHLDRGFLDRLGPADAVESAVKNYELAFLMQSAVPELMDLSGETEATKRLYGVDAAYEHTRTYATMCLLARRLVQRGVRFIELTCPRVAADRWDQHGDLRVGHEANALAVDQPIAGLLKDLRSHGLLDSTLVVWAGEFGRTPMAQGPDGRDHNPHGFTIWLAGGGIRGGMTYGSTDEYGYFAVENKVEVYDLHATMLHLLGIDHKQLTVRFSGRDMRLTDVHGNVMHDWLA